MRAAQVSPDGEERAWVPYLKCMACGYAKNETNQGTCNLCGAKLDSDAKWVSDRGGGKAQFGVAQQSRSRGAAKKIDNTAEVKPDQIVYAGDFAIVYVFTHHPDGMFILQPGEVFTFGRGDNADHKIDSKMVSRRHARIHWGGVDPPTPEILDLESKNGILVNGVPVKRKSLEDGDEITIGSFTATLRVLTPNMDLRTQIQTDRLSSTTVTSQRLHGEVKLISIPWLMQHLERQKESGTLTVHDRTEYGYVALISGVAIAAGFGDDLEGADAIKMVARIRGGRFSFSPHADIPPQNIGKTIGEILNPPAKKRRPPPTGRGKRRPPGPPPRRRPR